MKIIFIESCAGIGISFAKGQAIDLPPADARQYIRAGIAKLDEDPKDIKPDRPLKPIVQEVKKSKSRPQKRNVKTNNSKGK